MVNMKRTIYILLACLPLVSCYDDYVKDFDMQAVGFANATDVRSVVVGESNSFRTGVALGGVIHNDTDRPVDFSVDYSLVNAETYSKFKSHTFSYISALFRDVPSIEALPASMYSLLTPGKEGGRTVVKAGSHVGEIQIDLAPSFLEDNANIFPHYVIPLRISDAHGTQVMDGHESSVIGVRFECLLFGSWWHGGEMSITDDGGNVLENKTFYTEIPEPDTRVWTLTTVGAKRVSANAVGDELNGTKAQMSLTLGDNGQISVSAVPGADYVVEQDGECRYNQARLLQDRKLFLQYKYTKDGKVCHVKDTLTFRNRIRDGVNEWQDENKENY